MASYRVATLGGLVLVSLELANVESLGLHAGRLSRGISPATIQKVPWGFRAEVRGSVVFSASLWFAVFEALAWLLFKILWLRWKTTGVRGSLANSVLHMGYTPLSRSGMWRSGPGSHLFP